MPELPEVETVARKLRPVLIGQRMLGGEVFDKRKIQLSFRRAILKRRVTDVLRRGKEIVLCLGPGDAGSKPVYLCFHLRMTGRLLWFPEADAAPFDSGGLLVRTNAGSGVTGIRAEFRFDSGRLLFADVRRFGTVRLLDDLSQAGSGGVDPTSPEFTFACFSRLLAHRRQELKSFLLRQDLITGIGNIYASEILFRAALAPRRTCASLSKSERRALFAAVRSILNRAIRWCGTTFSDFQDPAGAEGSYQRFLRVYDAEGRSCSRCGASISRIVQGSRSTYFCPGCQK